MTTTELDIRFATKDDFDAITKMSQNLFDGHDFLPALYHSWMDSDHMLVFVGTMDGNIVSLLVAHFIDGGRTVVHRGLRVDINQRGKGISTRMACHVDEYIRANYSSVERVRSTAGVDGEDDASHIVQLKHGMAKIMEKSIVSYFLPEVIEHFCDVTATTLFTWKLSDIMRQIHDEHFLSLFEHNVHVSDWVPYEVTLPNIDEMFHHDDYCLVNVDPDNPDFEAPSSFSHARVSVRVDYTHLEVTVYTKDASLLKSHLMRHLRRAVAMELINPIFVLFVHKEMVEMANQLLKGELQLEETTNYPHQMNLYEQKL